MPKKFALFLLLFFSIFNFSPIQTFAEETRPRKTTASSNPSGLGFSTRRVSSAVVKELAGYGSAEVAESEEEIGISEGELEELSDLEDKIKEYERKIAELQGKERTLQNEISYMDSQIYLTSLRIQENEAKILAKEKELEELRLDIGDLQDRIIRLGELLDEQRDVFGARARESYKTMRLTPFEIVFGVPNLSRLVERIKYLRVLELQDRKLLEQMERTREGCTEQKELLEVKKAEVEELKAEIERYKQSLEAHRASLTRQKADKQYLLEITRGEEARYQQILSQLLAEKEALESIYLKGLTDGTKVEKGKLIAQIGNSGYPCCSTGLHLHFEVRKCDEDGSSCVTVDPAKYLEKEELVYAGDEVGKINPSGDWPWPVENPRITQEYGETFWTRTGRAPYKFHTGIDITSLSSSTIKAVDDGVMYRSSVICGGSCTAKYVAIDHGDGLWTIYFHVK